MNSPSSKILLVLSVFLTNSTLASQISSLTEIEFNQQFRCPETFLEETDSKRALADSLEWYQAHHQTVTTAGFLTFRMQLLASHKCEVTLANVAKTTVIPNLPIPTYNSQKACRKNKECIKSETEVHNALIQIWPGIGSIAKEYCLTEGAKAGNISYLTLANCLAQEDRQN